MHRAKLPSAYNRPSAGNDEHHAAPALTVDEHTLANKIAQETGLSKHTGQAYHTIALGFIIASCAFA